MMNTEKFYQWDTNKTLTIEDANIKEVHFSNVLTPTAIVVEVVERDGKRYVDIPQMLLEQPYTISAYASCGECVEYTAEYEVIKRAKPDNYNGSTVSSDYATGTFKKGDNTVITHGLGVLPSYIVIYADSVATAPSNIEEIYQTYRELVNVSARKLEDDTYATRGISLSYQKFEYYGSLNSTNKSTRMIQRIAISSGLKITDITLNTFTVPEDYYNDKGSYRWIALA